MAAHQCIEDLFGHVTECLDHFAPFEATASFGDGIVLFAREHISKGQWFVTRLRRSQSFIQGVDVTTTAQVSGRVEGVGFAKPSASATYTQRLQRVIRDVSSTDLLAGAFGAVEQMERDHHAVLE